MFSGDCPLLLFQCFQFPGDLPDTLRQRFCLSGCLLLSGLRLFILTLQLLFLTGISLDTAVTVLYLTSQTLTVRLIKLYLLFCLGNVQDELILLYFHIMNLPVQSCDLFLQSVHGIVALFMNLFMAALALCQNLFLCLNLQKLLLKRSMLLF